MWLCRVSRQSKGERMYVYRLHSPAKNSFLGCSQEYLRTQTHAHSQLRIPRSLSIKFPKSMCTLTLQKVTGCQVHRSALFQFQNQVCTWKKQLGKQLLTKWLLAWRKHSLLRSCHSIHSRPHEPTVTVLNSVFTVEPPTSCNCSFWQTFIKTHKSPPPSFMNHTHTDTPRHTLTQRVCSCQRCGAQFGSCFQALKSLTFLVRLVTRRCRTGPLSCRRLLPHSAVTRRPGKLFSALFLCHWHRQASSEQSHALERAPTLLHKYADGSGNIYAEWRYTEKWSGEVGPKTREIVAYISIHTKLNLRWILGDPKVFQLYLFAL